MAERHLIVVHVMDGRVRSVAFCDCCALLTVEVRTYETPSVPSDQKQEVPEPSWPVELGDGRFRDNHGVFQATYYEPDND